MKVWSIFFSAFLLIACEDHNTLLTLRLPEYVPQLVIQSAASPQSGAMAIIQYSRPMKGVEATIPELPIIEVFLLENGKRIQAFKEDAAGRFSIAPENVNLKMDMPYSIEVILPETDESYFSEASYLPQQPLIQAATGWINNPNDPSFNLRLRLSQVEHPIKAYSIQCILLDDSSLPYQEHSLNRYLTRGTLQYPEEGLWMQKDISESRNRIIIIDQESPFYAQSSEIRIAYFSDELAQFLREVSEISSFGEEIFHSVRPVFSNIKDGVGIFGLYHEQVSRVEIKMN